MRHAYVAGKFYPGTKEEIISFIEANLSPDITPQKARAIMVPHAGYVYSGKTALKTIQSVTIPETVILLGPNHTGYGAPVSVYPTGEWETPLGHIPIDETLASYLIESHPLIEANVDAHRFEHCLEVILPFLQYFQPKLKIVPIIVALRDQDQLDDLIALLTDLLKERDPFFVISSDMTHYESVASAAEKDELALKNICSLDNQGLLEVVVDRDISMCGILPAYVSLGVCKALGATKGDLVEYTNSGVVTGDRDQVVGYAGVTIR